MNAQKPDAKPLELELVAIDPPPADPSQSKGPATQTKSLGITNADFYLEEAAREYQSGKIDQALWARTVSAAGEDESIAIAAYLRGRAAALRLEQANRTGKAGAGNGNGKTAAASQAPAAQSRVPGNAGPATRSRSEGPATRSGSEGPATRSGSAAPSTGRAPRAGSRGVPRNVIYLGAAAAAVAFVAVLLWVMAAPAATENARAAVNAAVKRPEAAPRPAAAPVAPPDAPVEPTLAQKVDEMKRNGNWNVMVLYANEWTRKEPTNAAAWRELGLGYTNLRQLDDAREAATRAVALAPADAGAWNGLGRVNLALERWSEAGAAFDKALGVSADDTEALCGAMAVARRDGRPKDADALARRMSDPSTCRNSGESESVAVAPRSKGH